MPGFNKDGKAGSGMGQGTGSGMGRGQGLGRGQGRGLCQNTGGVARGGRFCQNTSDTVGIRRRLGQCFRNLINQRSNPEQSQSPTTTNQYEQKD